MTEFDQNSETKIGLDGLPNSFQMDHEFSADGVRSAIAEVQARVSKLATLAAANADFVLPHQSTYVSQIEFASKTYWSRFDEALRAGYADALAMRRDPFIHMLLRHRQIPTALLEHTLVADGNDDPEKRKTVEQIRRVFDSTPRFQTMKMILLESIFYGKYGVELSFEEKWIDGRKYFVVADFRPIHGDKIIFKYDGTPGIFVYPKIASLIKDSRLGLIEQADIGPALFLKTKFWRRRFIIHEFEPTDTDYMFEADMGGSVHGVGLRGRLYWGWYQRKEILAWAMDAMQRISTNGALVGYYPSGNVEAKTAMIAALKQIQQYGFAVCAVEPSMSGTPSNSIQHIEPASIAYDVLMKFIEYQDSILRQAVLGQDLSTSAAPTGLGSGVAELQGQVRSDFILYDANMLAERLTSDLLKTLVAFNSWDFAGRVYNGWLPFDVKSKFVTDRQDIDNRLKAAQTMVAQLGIDIDKDKLLEEVGFSSPRTEEASVLASMQAAQMAMMQPGQGQLPPPGQGPPPTDAEVPQEGEQPAPESQSLPPTQDEEDESRIVRYSMGDNLGTATAPKAKAPQPAAATKTAPKQPAQTQEFREFKPTKNDPKLNLNISQPLTIGGKEFKGTVEHGTPQYRHILDRASVHEYEGENHQRQAAGIGEAHEIEHLQHHLRHGDPKKFPAQLESLYDPYKGSHESPLGHNAVAKLYPGRKDGPNLSPSKEEAKGTVRKLPIPESVSFNGINGKIRKLEAGRTVERHGPDYSELLENADPHVLASAPFTKDFNKHQIVSHMMRRHRNALTSEQNAQEHKAAQEKKGNVDSALKEVEASTGRPVDKNAAIIKGKQIESERERAAEKQGELPFQGKGVLTKGDAAAAGLRRVDAQTKLSPGKTAKDRAENAKNDEIERQGTAFLKEAEARKKATANQSAPTEQEPLGRPPGPALAEAEATTAPEPIAAPHSAAQKPAAEEPKVAEAAKAAPPLKGKVGTATRKTSQLPNILLPQQAAQKAAKEADDLDLPSEEWKAHVDAARDAAIGQWKEFAATAKDSLTPQGLKTLNEMRREWDVKSSDEESAATRELAEKITGIPVAEPKAAEVPQPETQAAVEPKAEEPDYGNHVSGYSSTRQGKGRSKMMKPYKIPHDIKVGRTIIKKGVYHPFADQEGNRNKEWTKIEKLFHRMSPEEQKAVDPNRDLQNIKVGDFPKNTDDPFVHVAEEPKAAEQVSAAPTASDTIKRFPEEIAPVKATEEIKPAETQADIDISEGVDDVQPDAGQAEQQRITAGRIEWKDIDPKLRWEYLGYGSASLDPEFKDYLWDLLDEQWEKFPLKKQVALMDLLQKGKLTSLSDEWLRQRIARDSIGDWEANSSDAILEPASAVPQFKDRKERSKPDRPKAKLFDPENASVVESPTSARVKGKEKEIARDKGFGDLQERDAARFDAEGKPLEETPRSARVKGKEKTVAGDKGFGELQEQDAARFDADEKPLESGPGKARVKTRKSPHDGKVGELLEKGAALYDPDEVRIDEEGKTKARAKGKPPAKDAGFGELREKDAALLDPEEAKLADEGVKARVKTAPTAKSQAALEPSKPFDADKTEIGRSTFSPEAVTKANLSDEETRDFVRFMKSHRSEAGNIETLRDFVGDDATDRLIQALGYDGIKQSKWKKGDKVAPPPTTRAFLPTEPPKQEAAPQAQSDTPPSDEPKADVSNPKPNAKSEPKQKSATRSAQAKQEQREQNIAFLLKTPFENLHERHQKALLSGPRHTWPKEVQDYLDAAETKRNKGAVANRVKTGEVARRQEDARRKAETRKNIEEANARRTARETGSPEPKKPAAPEPKHQESPAESTRENQTADSGVNWEEFEKNGHQWKHLSNETKRKILNLSVHDLPKGDIRSSIYNEFMSRWKKFSDQHRESLLRDFEKEPRKLTPLFRDWISHQKGRAEYWLEAFRKSPRTFFPDAPQELLDKAVQGIQIFDPDAVSAPPSEKTSNLKSKALPASRPESTFGEAKAKPDRTKEILSRLRELSDKSEAAKQKNSASRDASGFNKIMARVDQLLNKSKREKLKAAERDESERLLAELDSLLKKEQGRKN